MRIAILFSIFATTAFCGDTYWFCNNGTPGDGTCNTFCCKETASTAFSTKRKILGNGEVHASLFILFLSPQKGPSGPDHKTQKCKSGNEEGQIFCA
ncbi:hypothetical protein EJ03DRAFT_352959 [Teratosphaeria nubilosa]|uniref:Secreted protein n=1 Tax=Teratosphaeria nubilosa TaxID=161662 RepID=A0A6G1L4X7_9PEZI|nr:hypothetical protein EJ03DRAFT_352959 [Teratosphaeria nubilosa]